jgi:hypothetical protein
MKADVRQDDEIESYIRSNKEAVRLILERIRKHGTTNCVDNTNTPFPLKVSEAKVLVGSWYDSPVSLPWMGRNPMDLYGPDGCRIYNCQMTWASED